MNMRERVHLVFTVIVNVIIIIVIVVVIVVIVDFGTDSSKSSV